MATIFEKYGQAPIILAILQIRYNKVETFDAGKIRSIGENNSFLKRKFPIINDRIVANYKFDKSKTSERVIIPVMRPKSSIKIAGNF